EAGNHLDDFADMLRGPRHMIDAGYIEPFGIADVIGSDALGELGNGRVLFLSLHDELVVHVGDIDDEDDLVAEVREAALDRVEDDRSNQVADMAGLVDGG